MPNQMGTRRSSSHALSGTTCAISSSLDLSSLSASLVLMDPPYGSGLAAPALERLRDNGWLRSPAVLAIELAKDEAFSPPEGFQKEAERRFGAARFVFLRHGGG